MRNVLLTILISVVLSAGFYLVATAIGLPSEEAKGLAGLPAFGAKNIYEFLEARSAKHDVSQKGTQWIKSFGDFSIRPLSLFAFALLMFTGVFSIIPAVSGFFTGFAYGVQGLQFDPKDKSTTFMTMAHALPLYAVAVFHIGRWIGTRSSGSLGAFLITTTTLVLGGMLSTFGGMFLMSPDVFLAYYGQERTLQSAVVLTGRAMPTAIMICLFSVGGVVLGRRRQFTRYFGFLLELMPPGERTAIVELARDEALIAAGHGGRHASGVA